MGYDTTTNNPVSGVLFGGLVVRAKIQTIAHAAALTPRLASNGFSSPRSKYHAVTDRFLAKESSNTSGNTPPPLLSATIDTTTPATGLFTMPKPARFTRASVPNRP